MHTSNCYICQTNKMVKLLQKMVQNKCYCLLEEWSRPRDVKCDVDHWDNDVIQRHGAAESAALHTSSKHQTLINPLINCLWKHRHRLMCTLWDKNYCTMYWCSHELHYAKAETVCKVEYVLGTSRLTPKENNNFCIVRCKHNVDHAPNRVLGLWASCIVGWICSKHWWLPPIIWSTVSTYYSNLEGTVHCLHITLMKCGMYWTFSILTQILSVYLK